MRWPLHWRLVQAGDRWQPLGARGHQRVMKSLADRKVPLPVRAQVSLFADQEGVVWVPGLGISARVRVRPGSPTCLQGWWLPA